MIIFGFGHKKNKNLGPVGKIACPNCNNEDFWELVTSRTYFTLFFVPLIPYSSENFIMCPICRVAREVHGDELERMKASAQSNLRQIQGR